MAEVIRLVLFDDRGRQLLVQDGKPESPAFKLWTYPGGYRQDNETPAQTAIREAWEEVGLSAEIIQPEPIHQTYIAERDLTLLALLGRITGGTLRVDRRELEGAGWYDLGVIRDLHALGRTRDDFIWQTAELADAQRQAVMGE